VEAAVFFVCAALVLAGAFGVVLARNPVHSALFLLLTLASVAVLFVVYASAIVVLFLFVITLLGVDQHESLDEPQPFQRIAAIVFGALVLISILVLAHGNRWVTGARSTRGELDVARSGNVQKLAESLFTNFVWAFEMTAVLLVIAVVGGVVLARRSGHRPQVPVGGEAGA
jgi:NADH-quinone oxidoreductase subunit J